MRLRRRPLPPVGGFGEFLGGFHNRCMILSSRRETVSMLVSAVSMNIEQNTLKVVKGYDLSKGWFKDWTTPG